MALDLTKIKALAEEAAKTGPDLNTQSAGGDFKPPAAGATRLRFTSYIELGIHTTSSKQWGDKTKGRAAFTFELSGPKHPPKKLDDGRLIPETISFELPIGQNKKNDYSKLFKIMVADHPGAKNFAQLLGEAYRGEVIHRKFKRRDGSEGLAADLKNEAGFTIKSVLYEDPESGEARKVKVDEPIGAIRVFLWDHADLDQWDSIFIDGTFDDGNTKNKLQDKIRRAENISGSAIEQALIEAGREEELIPAVKQEGGNEDEGTTDADDDAPVTDDPPEEPPAKAPEPAQKPAKPAGKGKVAPTPAKPATAPKSKAPVETDDDPLQGL